MGRLIPDLLRAIADGWDKAAGPDPVDQHATEAAELLRPDQCHCIWCTEPAADDVDDEDPDEVVVTAAVDQDKVIQLGLDLQAARRTIIALRAKLAEKNTDPADTATVGTNLGYQWINQQGPHGCNHASGGPEWRGCIRAKGHTGQHVSTARGIVTGVWPQDPAADQEATG